MKFRRIQDAVRTLLTGSEDEQLARLKAEARGLIVEMTNALELLNAYAAREAKRRARAAQEALRVQEDSPMGQPLPALQLTTGGKLTPQQKGELLRRHREGQTAPTAHEDVG